MFESHKVTKGRKWYIVTLGLACTSLSFAFAYGARQIPSDSGTEVVEINPGHVSWHPEYQKIALEELEAAMREAKATSGFAIVADPNSGRILANANLDWRKTPREGKNWSLSHLMEPASVMKTLVVATALENGDSDLNEMHNCMKGKIDVGGVVFHDWKAFDKLTTADALVNSSTVCSIKVAQKVGTESMMASLEDFGFGKGGVASQFPEAAAGVLPQFANSESYVAIGFGFFVTPLELVQAYGAIANGGNLMKPQPYAPDDESGVVMRRVLSQDAAKQMRGVLSSVVARGTGKNARSRLYSTAGKTGTGTSKEVYEKLLKVSNSNVASFIGFAPASNPSVEVFVSISAPVDVTLAGGRNAAPAFKKIADRVLTKMEVESDL